MFLLKYTHSSNSWLPLISLTFKMHYRNFNNFKKLHFEFVRSDLPLHYIIVFTLTNMAVTETKLSQLISFNIVNDWVLCPSLFFIFLEDIFVWPLIPIFGTSDDVFSGFQSQTGQPYSHLAETYMLHVP